MSVVFPKFAAHLKHEKQGFLIDLPNGNDFYTFFHFIDPVTLKIDGEIIRTLSHACAFFTPDYPQYILADNFPLFHDYVCFELERPPQFTNFNKILYAANGDALSLCIENVEWVLNNKSDADDRNWRKEMTHATNNFLQSINSAETFTEYPCTYSEVKSMNELRNKIYIASEVWNVESMTRYVGMSRTQFYKKYNELFHTTPNADLTNAAMLRAEHMLINTEKTILEITYSLSYDSVDYFIRLFKKYHGCTPGEYRKTFKFKVTNN